MPSAFSHQHEASATTATGVEINDTTASTTTAYSGSKIEQELALKYNTSQAPNLPQTTTSNQVLYTTSVANQFTVGFTNNHGHFSKNSTGIFFDDGIVRLRWDGDDELMITQVGQTGITDVYATAHTFTNAVSFPSSNPMILSTVENDFTQRSSAHFVDFTIRSDSDATFPYYRIHYEVCSSTGTDLIYYDVKKYV